MSNAGPFALICAEPPRVETLWRDYMAAFDAAMAAGGDVSIDDMRRAVVAFDAYLAALRREDRAT